MDILRYLKGIFRWWWLLLLSVGLAAVASYYASSLQPPVFQTTTTLLVGQVTQKVDPTFEDFALSQQLSESYAQIATRQPILQAVVDSLALDTDWQNLKKQVYVATIPRTQLLGINVSDTSPERAVAIADELAYQLILRSPTSPENETRQERGQFVEDQLNDLEKRINGAKARIIELEKELDAALSARQIQELQTEISTLGSFIDGWQKNYAELLAFLQGGTSPNYLTVIEPAQLPTTPISPNIQLNVALAVAVGFLLAVMAAMVLEHLDDSIKTADDFKALPDITVLANIVQIKGTEPADKLVTVAGPFSAVSEVYRLLRTNLQFSAIDESTRSILITSPGNSEGKSTTVANLGITMAQADLKTIIVDADLRRPTQHTFFHLPNLTGLSEILCMPELRLEGRLKETGIENLRLLTAGPLPPNPSELLGSKRMGYLIEHLQDLADVVIFDSAPALLASDTSILATKINGVVLVAWAGRTRRDAARETVTRLQHVGARIFGGVLNHVDGNHGHYGYYYNSYYSDPGSGKPPGKPPGKPATQTWRRRFSWAGMSKSFVSFRKKTGQISQR